MQGGSVPPLRPYQVEGHEGIREAMRAGARRVVYCLPTGGGKTTVAANMIAQARALGKRCAFLAHRRELIEQASKRLDAFGIPHGVVMASHKRQAPWEAVQVGSVQTMHRRGPPSWGGDFQLVIVDECHRTLSPTYLKLLERLGDPYVVGLSATPYRTDGKGLGDYYQGIVMGPSVQDLTDMGYLVPCTIYSPPVDAMAGAKKARAGDYRAEDLENRMNRTQLVGDMVDHWMKLGRDRPSVAFGVSVAHSIAIRDTFREHGVKAEHIDGETPLKEREGILEGLALGYVELVSSVGVLTEGWDCPPASCAILARPTLSRGLYKQMAGRILRTHPGKESALILDHAGCALEHGHVMEPDVVDLETKVQGPGKGGGGNNGPATRVCGECFAHYWKKEGPECPHCGHVNVVGGGTIEVVEGTLEEFKPREPVAKRPQDTEPQRQGQLDRLRAQAQEKGYKRGWVFYRLMDLYGREEARRLMPLERSAGW